MILDTNALSALADKDSVLESLLESSSSRVSVPVVVLGEYRFGISQSKHRRVYEDWLESILSELTVLPVIESTTVRYAEVSKVLKKSGKPIPTNDIWIAALALEHDEPLVSRDEHFRRIRGVRLIGW